MNDQAMLKLELEKSGTVRVQPDQFNYRSPKKYVSIENLHILYIHSAVISYAISTFF